MEQSRMVAYGETWLGGVNYHRVWVSRYGTAPDTGTEDDSMRYYAWRDMVLAVMEWELG